MSHIKKGLLWNSKSLLCRYSSMHIMTTNIQCRERNQGIFKRQFFKSLSHFFQLASIQQHIRIPEILLKLSRFSVASSGHPYEKYLEAPAAGGRRNILDYKEETCRLLLLTMFIVQCHISHPPWLPTQSTTFHHQHGHTYARTHTYTPIFNVNIAGLKVIQKARSSFCNFVKSVLALFLSIQKTPHQKNHRVLS